jgi:hypothetical protein
VASNTIRVSILGDWKSLDKTFKEAEGGTSKWASNMETAGKGLTLGLTAPIIAGAALATKAAADEQKEMETLADTIRKRIPGATDEAIAANEEWVTSLQNGIAESDGDIRALEQRLLSAGASTEEAQRLTALAYDVAAQTGKDAATVAEGFAKGINGNVTSLGKLGVATKNAAGETLSFEEITASLADTMGGSAAAAADTSAGRAELLQLKIADLTESIGTLLLPILDALTSALSGVVDWMTQLSPGAQKAALAVAGVAAAVGPVLMVVPKVLSAFKAVAAGFKALTAVLSANPWLLLIAAVVAVVVLIITNWDKISAFLKKTWENISRVAKAIWEGIKNAIKAAADWLVQMFLRWTLAGIIIKNWDKIRDGVIALKDWLIRTWNSIVDFFKGLPGKIGRAVAGMWDGIRESFRAAVNWIIRKWNNLEISIGGGSILGVDIPKITIRTPNIPTFAGGGVFRAPPGANAGLAVLHDRERVIPSGTRAAAPAPSVVNINITAGFGADPTQIAKAVLEALQRYQRVNGPLPLDVRLN